MTEAYIKDIYGIIIVLYTVSRGLGSRSSFESIDDI